MFLKHYKLFFALLLFSFASVRSYEPNCVLPLPRYAFFAPLIFSTNGTLLYTETIDETVQGIKLSNGDRVVLSCAPNYFKNYPNSKVLEATCKSQKTLVINDVEKNFLKDLACEVRSVEEILKPIDGCPGELESVEYGYANPIREKSYVLGEACYSKNDGKTLFVHTKISKIGHPINEQLKTKDQNYFAQKHPDSKYKIDFLMASRLDTLNERLSANLGSNKIPFLEPRNFINLKLLPNKQFQSILRLGWNYVVANGYDHLPNIDLLHDDILALNTNGLDVYTGTHGVLTLPNNQGQSVELYLRDEDGEKKYPVPKFIWTVVKHGYEIAAFAVLNNPEATEKDIERESFCESKCSEISWLKNLHLNDAHKNAKDGYVLCCSFDEFSKNINEMPQFPGKFESLV